MEEHKAGIGQRAIGNHSLLLRFPSAFSPSLNLFLMGNLHQRWEGKGHCELVLQGNAVLAPFRFVWTWVDPFMSGTVISDIAGLAATR